MNHGGGLLVAATAGFDLQRVGGGGAGGGEEPGAQGTGGRDGGGLARKDQEDRLGDVLGELAVADATHGGGVNEVDMVVNEVGEGGFLAVAEVATQEGEVVDRRNARHRRSIVQPGEEVTKNTGF